MVFEDELGVVEETTYQGGFPVIDAAAGDESQHGLAFVLLEVRLDVFGEEVVHRVGH